MTPQLLRSAFLVLCVLLSACEKLPEVPADATPDPGPSDTEDLDLVDVVDPDTQVSSMPSEWRVLVAPDVEEAVGWAADDVVSYLQAMGQSATRVEATEVPTCTSGQGVVVFVSRALGEVSWDTPPLLRNKQTWRIDEERCDAGAVVRLSGFRLLGKQFVAYAWLHTLGVRFFHPEQEYIPLSPSWPASPITREHTPPFTYNSVSLHLTHPLELGDPIREGDSEYDGEVKRYIDWNIKNFASFGKEGHGTEALQNYGVARGFPRSKGLNLYNSQQGGRPVVDPDDPRTVAEQIEAALNAQIDPDDPPDIFSFSFNPSEFTEIDDQDAVEQMTLIADWFTANYPDVELYTTNHGTGGEPTAHYGVRYFDLPQYAPANLGVKVHTLMFYDLFRPAPVYGNANFRFLFDFMAQEYQTRNLWHFPEAAWWLTFDIAVPLYLPITIESRDRDLQALAFMLEGNLNGHRSFGSGHEWGYWQNEYCSLRMAADLAYRWTDCVADIASPAGPAAEELAAVIEATVQLQERDIIYGDILAYLVGTDPETEIAASVGIQFHPLPPAPAAIMRWDLEQVTDWQRRIRPQLEHMADDYDALIARLEAVESLVPENGRSWFDEVRDGIEATGLRAQHAAEVYGAVVMAREAQLRFDPALADAADRSLSRGVETTTRILEVIHRREQGYRYLPLERSIGGGPEGTEDDNWTVYTYRYLNRTHHGYYLTRIDDLAAAALAGGDDVVEVADTVISPTESLEITVVNSEAGAVDVDWGDGTMESGMMLSHPYGAEGLFDVAVTGMLEGQPIAVAFPAASVRREWVAGRSGRAIEPAGTEIIEGVMPGVTLARIDDTRLLIGFSGDNSGEVPPDRFEVLEAAPAEFFSGAIAELRVPLVNGASGDFIASIIVLDATVSFSETDSVVRLEGELETQTVVDAIVSIGGFDEQGARSTVAMALGFTPDNLPAEIGFVAEYTLPP